MRRALWVGLVIVGFSGAALCLTLRSTVAVAEQSRDEAPWEYKVMAFYYNPGERLTDEKRAASFARVLNEQAHQGWEPVGSILSRDGVQTVGGAVTTRDTTSFVAFRRRR
jgi:hypothetical protein